MACYGNESPGDHSKKCAGCEYCESRGYPDPERTITEQDVNLKEFDVRYVPNIENPFKVYNDIGQDIGTAVVTLVDGAFNFHLILDAHNPEVLDLQVDPKRVSADLSGFIDATSFIGGIIVRSK